MAKVEVTPLELCKVIDGLDSHSFAGFRTQTKPTLNKKGRVTGQTIQEKLGIDPSNIVKLSAFIAGIGYDYPQMVQNRLLKEGKSVDDYQKGNSWHIPYGDSKTIRKHKDKDELFFYAFLVANNPSSSIYMDVSTGNEIAKADLEEYLKVNKAPVNQGLEEGNEVKVRTLKLNSVVSLSAMGNEYSVKVL